MNNPWITFVKRYAQEHQLTFAQALSNKHTKQAYRLKGGNKDGWVKVPPLIGLLTIYIQDSHERIENYKQNKTGGARVKHRSSRKRSKKHHSQKHSLSKKTRNRNQLDFKKAFQKDDMDIDGRRQAAHTQKWLEDAKLRSGVGSVSLRAKAASYASATAAARASEALVSATSSANAAMKAASSAHNGINDQRTVLLYNTMQYADARHDFDDDFWGKLNNDIERAYGISYNQLMKRRFNIDEHKINAFFPSIHPNLPSIFKEGKKKHTNYEINIFNEFINHPEWFGSKTPGMSLHFFRQDGQRIREDMPAAFKTHYVETLQHLYSLGNTYFVQDGGFSRQTQQILVGFGLKRLTTFNTLWDSAPHGEVNNVLEQGQIVPTVKNTYMETSETTNLFTDARNVSINGPLFTLQYIESDQTFPWRLGLRPGATRRKRSARTSHLDDPIFIDLPKGWNPDKPLMKVLIRAFELASISDQNLEDGKVAWHKVWKFIQNGPENAKTFVEQVQKTGKAFTYKFMIMLCYDMKKTGDWGQVYWARNNKNTMFVSKDRLALLFSIYLGNCTLGEMKDLKPPNGKEYPNQRVQFMYEGAGESKMSSIAEQRMDYYFTKQELSETPLQVSRLQQGGSLAEAMLTHHPLLSPALDRKTQITKKKMDWKYWKANTKHSMEQKIQKLESIKSHLKKRTLSIDEVRFVEMMYTLFNNLSSLLNYFPRYGKSAGLKRSQCTQDVWEIKRAILKYFAPPNKNYDRTVTSPRILNFTKKYYNRWERKIGELSDTIVNNMYDTFEK
jgi:hypothetical protein